MEDLFVRWGKKGSGKAGSAADPAPVPESGTGGLETSAKPEGTGSESRGQQPSRIVGTGTSHRIKHQDTQAPSAFVPGGIQKTAEQDSESRAILAGCCVDLAPDKHARAMSELKGLADACGLTVVSMVVQNAAQITHATYIGSGKVLELKREIEELDADIVIFNEALTPMQMRNLEKELDTEVLDRTGLILQIFSSRARTREAKLQVESARLQYMLPRLVGMRASLSRQGGGSGRLSNKGAGEQKLELDRRRIEKRIAELRRELDIVERERTT